MKKKKIIIYAVVSAACIFLLTALASAAATMSIQVRETQLRATPGYFGKIISRASYGDQVTVEGAKGSWKKVRLKKTGRTGWINSSALSAKEIKLVAGAKGTKGTASASELQLAGKGFNPEVEKEFKNRNRQMSFRWVDKMEQIVISDAEKQKFAQEGGLRLNGNGGR